MVIRPVIDVGHLPSAVVCIGAGKWQVIVIRKAKELGLAVIAVDRDPDAPGFALSDERLVLSTQDAGPIINRVSELRARYQLVGVVNRSSGIPVVTAAKTAQAYGLPGVPCDSARTIVDKAKFQKACAAKGLHMALRQSVSTLAKLRPSHVTFPCVLKPAMSMVGKSGVRIVTNAASLADAFAAAQAASVNGVVNVEEFVSGRDVSLVAFVARGRLYALTLLDELNVSCDPGFVKGVGFAVPSLFTGYPEESHIIDLACQIVKDFGLDTTPFMLSCRCAFGGLPTPIELHLDLGGDLILDALLPASSSLDVLEFAINLQIGKCLEPVSPAFRASAVIYSEGDALVSDRPHRIFTAPDRQTLERLLAQEGVLYGVEA